MKRFSPQMETVDLFKALSDETRFKLFQLLLTHDLCVGALAYQLKVSEAAVSQHLKQLRKVGLVRGEKRGYWTHYTVEKNRLNELRKILEDLTHLEPGPEGGCVRNVDGTIKRKKGGANVCAFICGHPEKVKGNPKECTPEQIEKCHGTKKRHSCVPKAKKR
jgi:ArsR family transcriptional regulator